MQVDLSELREHLHTLQPGRQPQQALARISELLAKCWANLAGGGDGGMKDYKLLRELEDVHLDWPVLSFQIERHGGVVRGGSRASVQFWQVDLETGIASRGSERARQLKPSSPRLDVNPIAASLASAVREGRLDPCLNWRSATRVEISTGIAIPAADKQTTAGRHRRLKVELERLLSPDWRSSTRGGRLVFDAMSAT
jgi:hypothetical protein